MNFDYLKEKHNQQQISLISMNSSVYKITPKLHQFYDIISFKIDNSAIQE